MYEVNICSTVRLSVDVSILRAWALSGMMLSLSDCPKPANIEKENQITLIACEDVYDHDNVKSDNDMNDVVFMVYGKPEVPSTTEIENGQPIVKQTTVRYMIEDLGATDDFDFNKMDIVDSYPVNCEDERGNLTDSNY